MPWRDLAQILAVSLVAGLVMYLFPLPNVALVARVLIRVAVFAVVLGVAVRFTGVLREDERKLLLTPVAAARKLFGTPGRGGS
jgi:hypothetical protein